MKALSNTRAMLALLAAIWVVSLANLALGGGLDFLGIRPRSLPGLVGLATAPLVHASIGHLLCNSVPMALLGGLVCLRGTRAFWSATLAVALLGGLAVWLLGRNAVHIGASGLVFGYFGYLVALGFFERRPGSIALAVVTLALYSSLVWGVLPLRASVSWEGHLSGMLAGVLIAYLHARGGRRRLARG